MGGGGGVFEGGGKAAGGLMEKFVFLTVRGKAKAMVTREADLALDEL